jgi:RNA-binding protein
MHSLTPKQRSHLRSLAHPLKPIVQIGKDGITDTLIGTLENAFNTRELLKVKVLEAAPEGADEAGQTLAERIKSVQLVQVIGRTVVLFRPHPDKPKIDLSR